MSVSKLRNSTANGNASGAAPVSTALKTKSEDNSGDQAPADNPARDIPVGGELTTEGVTKYLQHTSAISCAELDGLISELRRLREKLVDDGGRIEQDVVEFATLNQSVIKLTEVVSDSVAHVKGGAE